MQSRSGTAKIENNVLYFERIKISNNNILFYSSDNVLTKKGRLSGVFNLNKYNLIFK